MKWKQHHIRVDGILSGTMNHMIIGDMFNEKNYIYAQRGGARMLIVGNSTKVIEVCRDFK